MPWVVKPRNCSPAGLCGQGGRLHAGPGEQALGAQVAIFIHLPQAQRLAPSVEDGDAAGGSRRRPEARNRLSLAQAHRLFIADPHFRPRCHPGLDRQQAGVQAALAAGSELLQGVQGPHPRVAERVHPEAAQLGHVGAATQQLAQVADQAADIGAGAAFHVQAQLRRRVAATQVVQQVGRRLQLEQVHVDLALLDFHHLAAARLGVQRLAAALERRVDRRALADAAGELAQGRVDAVDGEFRHRALAQKLPFGVVGVGGRAQAGDGVVGLARAKQAAGDLGGLAEADRQQAGGERIQAAGMAGLFGPEQVPGALQGLVGTQSRRLVEQQDAVEPAEHRAWLLAHASLSRVSMRSPRSSDSS